MILDPTTPDAGLIAIAWVVWALGALYRYGRLWRRWA
jgi:hypothetical protein